MRAQALRLGLAVAAAFFFNAILFAALAALNRPKPVVTDPDESVQIALYEPPPIQAAPIEPEPEPEPMPPEPAPAPVPIDAPEAFLEPMDLPPVLLDLAVPAIRVVFAEQPPREVPRAVARAVSGKTGGQGDTREYAAGERIDEPPEELSIRQPAYPAMALRRGLEGSVTLRVLIDERGRVEKVEVVRVKGHPSFRGAVLRVARKWRFTAPRHRGRPVRAWAIKTMHFRLEGA